MQTILDAVFQTKGYRYLQTDDNIVNIFYKYYKEGFHVVIEADLDLGYMPSAEEHHSLENRIYELFYHPVGRLADFPFGFPVYHVEILTVFVSANYDKLRKICTDCENAWGFWKIENSLIIYENQPGDFYGLQAAIEAMPAAVPSRSIKQQIYGLIHPQNYKPAYATILLTAINVLVFFALELIGDTRDPVFIEAYGGLYPEDILFDREWWRIFTSCFLHFGAAHLLNNMVIFCCVGSRLERVVGHWKLFVLFLLSGIGGSLLSYMAMLHTGSYAVSAGASGAVFGTIGGLLWVVIRSKGNLEGITTKGLLVMLALSLYYGFTSIGIDNWGHIGGLAVGFMISVILYHQKC